MRGPSDNWGLGRPMAGLSESLDGCAPVRDKPSAPGAAKRLTPHGPRGARRLFWVDTCSSGREGVAMAKKSLRGGGAPSNEMLDDQIEDAGVVAFDFDGTITVRDSFTEFLKWRVDQGRYMAGMTRLVPAAISYLGHRNRGRIKAAAVREFLKGMTRDELVAACDERVTIFEVTKRLKS